MNSPTFSFSSRSLYEAERGTESYTFRLVDADGYDHLFVYRHPTSGSHAFINTQTLGHKSTKIAIDLIRKHTVWLTNAEEVSYASDTLACLLSHYLLNELQQPQVDQSYVVSLGMTLSKKLSKTRQRGQYPAAKGLTPYQIRQIKTFVTDHLDQPLRLADLAAHLRLSCCYFARQFKQAVGQTPRQFVEKTKMQRAKELLLTTNFSVIAVGMEVGYDNPSHFSSAFKNVVGLSPVQLRKTQPKKT